MSSSKSSPIAVVTGASRGLGAEWTRQLLARGYEVHAVTRNAEKMKDFAKHAEGRLHIHAIDLEAKDGPKKLAAALGGAPISLLVNNAGIYLDVNKSFAGLDFEEMRKSFEVNTLLPARVTQALLPSLKKAKDPKIAQITSLMGSIGDNTSGGAYAYRVSKAALNMLNKSFAIDHPFVTSVVLHPGWVQTEMGGKQAPTKTPESVEGMLKVMDRITAQDSGKFYDFEGDEVAW